MSNRNEYAEKAATNEAMLRKAAEWLFADAEARTRHAVYGRQVLEINWENGAVQTINIDQRNTLKRGREATTPETAVLTPGGRPVE